MTVGVPTFGELKVLSFQFSEAAVRVLEGLRFHAPCSQDREIAAVIGECEDCKNGTHVWDVERRARVAKFDQIAAVEVGGV